MATGLKRYDPAFNAQGDGTPPIGQITPDEVDRYEIYQVLNPGATDTVGTIAAGTVDGDFTIGSAYLDYPRNVVLAAPGAVDYGGTSVVTGKDQFGQVITETIEVGTASNGGTTGGTKVFGELTSATWVHGGGDNAGTPILTTTQGTAYNAIFGLPCKIASTADVKRIVWLDNAVSKPNQTPQALVDATNYGFNLPDDGAAADSFVVWIKSTYDAAGETAPRVSNM